MVESATLKNVSRCISSQLVEGARRHRSDRGPSTRSLYPKLLLVLLLFMVRQDLLLAVRPLCPVLPRLQK